MNLSAILPSTSERPLPAELTARCALCLASQVVGQGSIERAQSGAQLGVSVSVEGLHGKCHVIISLKSKQMSPQKSKILLARQAARGKCHGQNQDIFDGAYTGPPPPRRRTRRAADLSAQQVHAVQPSCGATDWGTYALPKVSSARIHIGLWIDRWTCCVSPRVLDVCLTNYEVVAVGPW